MTRTIITCDHCGKELNSMKDYDDIEFDTLNEWFKTDLCSECYAEISRTIRKFCGK